MSFASAKVHFGTPFSLVGDFRGRFANVKVPVEFAAEPSFWLRAGLALFPLENLEGGGHLRVEKQRLTLTGLDFRSGSQRIAGRVDKDGENVEGKIYLRLLPLPFCYTIGGEDAGLSAVLSRASCLRTAE